MLKDLATRWTAMRAWFLVAVLSSVALAGCASVADDSGAAEPINSVPSLGYAPAEPDMSMVLDMFDIFPAGSTGNILHGRVVMPEGDGPFATIVQHTPYTAPGCNTDAGATFIEPPVIGCGEGTFENQFSRRGYVYIHADLRGTGDSDDCLNLRGQADIDDIGALADAIAAQPWSNGNVGFIGASYPGSTSHMAALSGSPAVKAVIPVVASTSFYNYHHNDGVPYNGNHALGGTNAGYTQQGVTPTANPASGIAKLTGQAMCPHVENAAMHGGLDQSGDYYGWWQERNLRPLAETVTTPVLMAQGLADWNVKPDHIESWFNDIPDERKTFIGGQWGHAYPATNDGACPDDYEAPSEPAGAGLDCTTPWGDWWAYAVAFFDTYLLDIDTGMFDGPTAWVQANDGTWHRSSTFPLLGAEADGFTLHLNHGQTGTLGDLMPEADQASWYACGADQYNKGQFAVATAESAAPTDCANTDLVFTSEPFTEDTLLSGIPLLNFTVDTEGNMIHLVAVLDVIDSSGNVVRARENYGYLNPRFYQGFPTDSAVPSEFFRTSLDFYPQEDLIRAGEALRLTLKSTDDGRTIEEFPAGEVTMNLAGDDAATLWLPTRPAAMHGTRLA
jgi:putative CocE/NonD family hydrolase